MRQVSATRFRERCPSLLDRLRPESVVVSSGVGLSRTRLFGANPNHPSLRFKKVEGTQYTYSARVGLGYRVLGVLRADVTEWQWIGDHTEYDRLT